MSRSEDVARIAQALAVADEVLARFTPGAIDAVQKENGGPLTEADTAVNEALAEVLRTGNEGWLSEENVDSKDRLSKARVWVVDPIDGTREFVNGVPEWCVSIGLIEHGVPVAGGVLSPPNNQLFLGSDETGVQCNGAPTRTTDTADLIGAVVLASHSELRRGEWARFAECSISIRPMGSVAYKLAMVSAGMADATWTLAPKNEWDIAGGAALVQAAGGRVFGTKGKQVRFNQANTRLDNVVATTPGLCEQVKNLLWP
ncbi:MAG: 3'(2'),5'-bisphosphate nucleotidase CysQ [Acidimicrobiia bacterium]|nr:3'(2'),5'-bisphosphate nucleotidase CysQ [Acidimicrobiia bacterium]MYC57058.1 3'(2'),5'-bisphosphate nucleotidase CysQ [Acidimicrobiia bacterium]MYG93665.1 3'(2'),5'-bisphosphate nucleotidase CysQ [Acidimicrobiia bacterium]MYI30135.1 3'(2'),5'-bisphosphate nucleotidase CysQ [Acidimicrobiia bacterium]